MSLWKKINFGILIFVLLLLGIVTFLITTSTGLHLLFNAANYCISGLEIGQVSGGWKNLHLKNIHYVQPGIMFHIDECYLEIKINYLQDSKFCINNLSLRNIYLSIDQKKISNSKKLKKGKNVQAINISTAYPVILNYLSLNNFHITIDNTIITVMHFSSSFYWKDKNLTLRSIFLKDLLVLFPKEVKALHNKNIKSKIQNFIFQKNLVVSKLKKFFSRSTFPKNINIHIPFNFNINEFKGEQLHLIDNNHHLVINTMLVKINNVNKDVYATIFNINFNQGSINMIGKLKLYGNLPLDFTINSILHTHSLYDERVTIKIVGALHKEVNIVATFLGSINSILYVKTKPLNKEFPFDINIISKKISLPFFSTKKLQANDSTLKCNGKITDYSVSFHTFLKGKNILPAIINFNAKGNEKQINIENLTILTSEGKTELTAFLGWKKKISWNGKLKFNNINMKKEIPNWSSKLDGLIEISGSAHKKNWQIDIPKIKITGNIRKNKINIEGQLKGNNYYQWIIPNLYINIGCNDITIKGNLGTKDFSLICIINALNLNNIFPELNGTAKGLIKVHGTVGNPQLLTNISFRKLNWKNLSVSHIKINSDIRYLNQINGKIVFRIENFIQSGINISMASLVIEGSEKKHDLNIKIKGNPVSSEIHLIGYFNHNRKFWKVRLNNTYFNTPIFSWRLTQSSLVDCYNIQQKINITSYYWNNSDVEICIFQINNKDKKVHVIVNFRNLDLSIFQKSIPHKTMISGILNGKIDVIWNFSKNSMLQGNILFFSKNTKLIQIVNENKFIIACNTLNIKADLYNNSAKVRWLVHLSDHSKFYGNIQIADLKRYHNLIGKVNIRNFNTDGINVFFLHKEKLSGVLNANLQFSGNIINPQIFGKIQLDNINVNGDSIPFNMKPSKILMNFNGMHLFLFGEIRTYRGSINLIGNADWSKADQWFFHIFIKSRKIRIIIPPMVYIDISPNVVFELTPYSCNFYGHMDIPWANIIVHELPENIINPSRDEVILNENLQSIKSKKINILINSNITLHIGDNVQIDAFGLKAKVNGNLKILQDKKGLSLNGEVNIPEGRFYAYGQDLLIQKGELLFSGPPDQPLINIEAIRNPDTTEDNIVVGIRITGMADEPKTEFFSNPIKSQQEILSYLLRGRGLDRRKNNNETVTSILLGIGIAQSNQAISKIGKIFGVKNLALDTQGIGSSSQVVVSGYILPDLQIKYGVGIFNSLATFVLRYRLMPKLYIEMLSGIDQSLDLLYQFDF